MAFSLSSIQFLPPSSSSSSSSSLQLKNPNYSPLPKFPKHSFPLTLTHTSNSIPYTTNDIPGPSSGSAFPPPMLKKRKRYRKEYPGESKGITQEMRFVAMKLKNSSDNVSLRRRRRRRSDDDDDDDDVEMDGGDDATWVPSLEGFIKYLVDSKLVLHTIERIVEDSNDVSYAYFRRSGLERSESLARDLEWFSERNLLIPEPSVPGVSYAAYLKELSEKSAPLFLSHFYNIYFAHIAGGQVISKQVVEKLLVEKELNLYKWDRDAEELLKDVREKLNRLSEHWSREDKNKCLKEATKSFRYMGQIVRLIIL